MTAPLARYADLSGETVFISGGATGIGRDLVCAFWAQEADVVFADIDAGSAEALRDDLAARGPAPKFIRCDVTNDDDLKSALSFAEARGGVAALINNAANDTRRDFEDVSAEDWARIVDVNLRHQFVAAQTVAPWMRARARGSIVNFGSVAPEMMVERLAVYSTCKAAVRGLTRSLARDLGGAGVRVNSILPGCILTDRQRALWFTDQSQIDAIVERQCLRRELSGDDVAAMALFLASDASAACTAQDFIVDGGMI